MSGTPDDRSPVSALAGTVLGFDFGTRKIGVAVGNTLTGSARALTTVRDGTAAGRFTAIETLVREWAPVVLVVGRPLHADGSAHATTTLAAQFAATLARRFAVPVAEVDERYTTQIAELGRREARERGKNADRDALAAEIILQAWLDERAA